MPIRPIEHGIFAGAAGGVIGAAYFAGGHIPSTSTYVTTVDKFSFLDDSRTTLVTGLSSARTGIGGAANSGTAAYFAGGYAALRGSTVDKFAFPDDGQHWVLVCQRSATI